MILYEVEGKLIVGKGEPDPWRCPDCRRFFVAPPRGTPEEEIRCPFCNHKNNAQGFKGRYIKIADARVLAYL